MEAIAGQPMAAELQAQMDWDESDLQVQGIFGSQISQKLHLHLGTNAATTWANLMTRFGTPGISQDSSGYVRCILNEAISHPQPSSRHGEDEHVV